MKNFRTYEISKEFYHMIEAVEWPSRLRDQALRAASSIVLNIADGCGIAVEKAKGEALQYCDGQFEGGPGSAGNQ